MRKVLVPSHLSLHLISKWPRCEKCLHTFTHDAFWISWFRSNFIGQVWVSHGKKWSCTCVYLYFLILRCVKIHVWVFAGIGGCVGCGGVCRSIVWGICMRGICVRVFICVWGVCVVSECFGWFVVVDAHLYSFYFEGPVLFFFVLFLFVCCCCFKW